MRTRFREQKKFLGKSVLVLQVAYEVDETGNDNVPPSKQCVNTLWRDAVVEDLTLLPKEQGE